MTIPQDFRGCPKTQQKSVTSANRWRHDIICSIFVSWLLIPISLLASPASVTIRLMDARSGKPLKGITIEMFTWQEAKSLPRAETHERAKSKATSNEDGRAIFKLEEPLPEKMGFLLVPPDEFGGCWGQEFSPREVLQFGVVASFLPKCGKLKWKATAVPGEIVIFEKKLTLWEQMGREIP